MKKFIKNLLLFFLPIFSSILLAVLFLFSFSKYVIKNSNQYDFNNNYEIAFLGDSHITNSVIDSVIMNSVNFSSLSESYYFTYQKLKFINCKSTLNKVILGFSYHNISPYLEKYINGQLSASVAAKHFFCLELKEQLKVLFWNKNTIVGLIKDIIRCGREQLKNNEKLSPSYSFYDGYLNTEVNFLSQNINSIEKRIKLQFYENNLENKIENLNLYYFIKIVNYCRKNNIEIICLTTPLHSKYLTNVPDTFKLKLKNIISDYDIDYINLESLKIPENGFLPDGDHLSPIGANITSKEIKLLLKRHKDKS